VQKWLGALVATLALGVAAWLLWPRPPPEPAEPELDEGVALLDGPDRPRRRGQKRRGGTLEQRVTDLEREVDALRRQVASAQLGRVVSAADDDASAESVEGSGFEAAVRSVYESERAREHEEASVRRQERMQARMEEAADELAQQAGLDDEQRNRVLALWTTEAERIVPLIESTRGGDRSFRDIREQLQTIRSQTDEQAATELSPAQLEAYRELRPRGPGGRRGPR
jgi:hypothetical protein